MATTSMSQASGGSKLGTAKERSIASNASTLPSIVKSIHGPGVKYLYLSGQKKFDSTFWDTRENNDFYNWLIHRRKVRHQNFEVDDQLPAEVTRHVDWHVERTKRNRMIEMKEIEEENKLLVEQAESSQPDYTTYRLDPITTLARTNYKELAQKTRQFNNKNLLDQNKNFYGKLRKTVGCVDFDKTEASFKNHLKQKYKLTRFPALNSHLLKGQAEKEATPSIKSAPESFNPSVSGGDTARDSQPIATDRSNKSKEPITNGNAQARRSLPAKETKKKTLLTALPDIKKVESEQPIDKTEDDLQGERTEPEPESTIASTDVPDQHQETTAVKTEESKTENQQLVNE